MKDGNGIGMRLTTNIGCCLVWIVFGMHQVQGQELSKYIVVDQFGYLPSSAKFAVIRDPQTGFDATESFIPGGNYAVVNVTSGVHVFTGSPSVWNSGTTDASSGDKAWWFDFSSVTEHGTYYVLDVTKNVRSYEFDISPSVYNEVLKHAVRTFYYQRAGFEKAAEFAGIAWADGASHIGPLQDKNCRVYNDKNNPATEMDVHGGWYDAGDYNKYTNWTANYIVDFMRAYIENPSAWGDDYNIPESGNGFPDLLDEAKWGLDFLLRMQKTDGAMLSIVGLAHASPPSSATGQSLYGTPSTSATLNSAGAFTIASKVYGDMGMTDFSNTLKQSAIKAWDWAEANPNVIFNNNDQASGTVGLGAGQQETNDYGRFMAKLRAACFLFELTGETKYRDFFDANYQTVHLIDWTYAYPFETSNQEVVLHYTTVSGATTTVVNNIKSKYMAAMNGTDNFAAFYSNKDPYRAYIKDYVWGSNSVKSLNGLMFYDMIHYGIDASKDEDARKAAEGVIHYLHGVNPLNIVYLSNMYMYGGENCVNEFYHTWFSNGSAKWDRVGVSTYGPAPGFVTGGPNPEYDWDGCCPGNCGGNNNTICNSESISPPKGQPVQKSYKDFNTSWPLNSWTVTENSCGYQINYIRLLSKFVDASYDCSGEKDGNAFIDACGQCAGGSTGVTPVNDATECPGTVTSIDAELSPVVLYPNPTNGLVTVKNISSTAYRLSVENSLGKQILKGNPAEPVIDLRNHSAGVYFVRITYGNIQQVKKIVKY